MPRDDVRIEQLLNPQDQLRAAEIMEDSFSADYIQPALEDAMTRAQLIEMDLFQMNMADSLCYGAFDSQEGIIAAVISTQTTKGNREINVIGVSKEHRCRGIAKMLLTRIRDEMPENELVLQTSSANEGGNSCYTKFGFVEFQRELDARAPGIDTVWYRFEIKKTS